MLSPETVAKRVTLAVEALPFRMRCGECGCQLPRALAGCVCPECGQDRSVLENGDGLELRLVEFPEAHREQLTTARIAGPTGLEGLRYYPA